jgi:hypothetical protein
MNQKAAQVFTDISPNNLWMCSMNHRVSEIGPKKLELFEPVAQKPHRLHPTTIHKQTKKSKSMNGRITVGNQGLTGESAPVVRLLFLARDLLLGTIST